MSDLLRVRCALGRESSKVESSLACRLHTAGDAVTSVELVALLVWLVSADPVALISVD